MGYIANKILDVGITLVLLDLFIVFMAMLQISAGINTPHIAFWDVQIKAVAQLLTIL